MKKLRSKGFKTYPKSISNPYNNGNQKISPDGNANFLQTDKTIVFGNIIFEYV